jgi:hypothetical protein
MNAAGFPCVEGCRLLDNPPRLLAEDGYPRRLLDIPGSEVVYRR